jgi:hypothetical protein
MPKKILEKLFGIFTRGQKDMSMWNVSAQP